MMPNTLLKSSGMFDANIVAAPRSRERVENIPCELIDNHPRNTTIVTERMLDPAFCESIAANGVLQPVLLMPQKDNERYYMLAGHKRLLASRLAAREYIRAIICRDLPPGLECIYLTDTNLQYGIKNMLPSEKCRTLYEQYHSVKEFRQYCRTHANEQNEIELGGRVIKFEHLEKTRDALAAAYGITHADVQRYLSLHTLCAELMEYVDNKKLAVSAATHLAPLPEEWQIETARWVEVYGKPLTAKQARGIAQLYQSGGSPDPIPQTVIRKREAPKTKRVYRVPRNLLTDYFQEMTDKEITAILEAALKFYYAQNPFAYPMDRRVGRYGNPHVGKRRNKAQRLCPHRPRSSLCW